MGSQRVAFTIFLMVILQLGAPLKYPNEIVDTPSVTCEHDRMLIKVKTSTTNPSHIYVDDFAEDEKCASRNQNRLTIPLGNCGMTSEKMSGPTGLVYRICISVQLHPLFVTANDRSYCAQCVYTSSEFVENLDETLTISDAVASELSPQFDSSAPPPKCTYSIRRDSLDGPKIHYAVVGQNVFHVWECQIDKVQVLVRNCYVEDGEGNRILIIDQNGCGVDQYILPTPHYSKDLRTASQETRVFKFADKTITRFACQIRLCSTEKENCRTVTPPRQCPTFEERIALQRKFRDETNLAESENGSNHGSLSRTQSIATMELSQTSLPTTAATTNNKLADIIQSSTMDIQRRAERSLHLPVKDLAERHRSDKKGENETDFDVVGVLTILDSPDEVKFFENNIPTSKALSCLSSTTHTILLMALFVLCLLHILNVLLCVINVRFLKKIFSKKIFNSNQ